MKEAAFFDLDKTLCALSTEKSFAGCMLKQNKLPLKNVMDVFWGYLKYDLNIVKDYDTMKKASIKSALGGRNSNEFRDIFRHHFTTRIKDRFYPELIREIDMHRKKGREIVIISAAIDFIVETCCEFLGISTWFATGLVSVNGHFTGETKGIIPYGISKQTILFDYAKANKINLNKSFAYGDSYSDYHMLKNVGNPVTINPDRKLKNTARANNWQINTLTLKEHKI